MNYRTAIILCGGKGTRLGELGKKLPKTLVKIQGKPILWYILKTLKKNGFNHFILPIGYRGEQIEEFLKHNQIQGCKIIVVKNWINTSLQKEFIKLKIFFFHKFLIFFGDAIFDANLDEICKKHTLKKRFKFICCEAEADFGSWCNE